LAEWEKKDEENKKRQLARDQLDEKNSKMSSYDRQIQLMVTQNTGNNNNGQNKQQPIQQQQPVQQQSKQPPQQSQQQQQSNNIQNKLTQDINKAMSKTLVPPVEVNCSNDTEEDEYERYAKRTYERLNGVDIRSTMIVGLKKEGRDY